MRLYQPNICLLKKKPNIWIAYSNNLECTFGSKCRWITDSIVLEIPYHLANIYLAVQASVGIITQFHGELSFVVLLGSLELQGNNSKYGDQNMLLLLFSFSFFLVILENIHENRCPIKRPKKRKTKKRKWVREKKAPNNNNNNPIEIKRSKKARSFRLWSMHGCYYARVWW